ncbi:MAG: stage III sporulation protein AD [Oscillospiraceae bacterium]|jgi:stage III sporulation protein AD|nr:stage III sporulation protein AD [Oscillospiraceae bacterium]
MDILVWVGLALAVTMLAVVIREHRPEMAILLTLAFGLMLFAVFAQKLSAIIDVMTGLSEVAALPSGTLMLLLRVIGIAYITEFAAQMCRDAGEGGIAQKVELGGRLLILTLSVPVLVALMQLMLELIPK